MQALLAKIRELSQEVEWAHQQGKMCTTGADAKASRGKVQDLVQVCCNQLLPRLCCTHPRRLLLPDRQGVWQ